MSDIALERVVEVAGKMTVFPFRPGDWVADPSERVAKVKAVYEGDPGEVLLDLIIYSDRGEKVGRESPICGGPRTYEPCCSAGGWERISEPAFPITIKWIPDGDGRQQARKFAADRLPPANWKKPERRRRTGRLPAWARDLADNELRRALEQIADGHNDARGLAETVLGKRGGHLKPAGAGK